MKYINKFDTISEAIARGGVPAPLLAVIGDTPINSGNIEAGKTIVFNVDASGNIVVEEQPDEKFAIIEEIDYNSEGTDGTAYLNNDPILPGIIYGVDGLLESRDGKTATDSVTFTKITTDGHEDFLMFSNWESYYDPTITYSAWYQKQGGSKVTTCEVSYVPDVPCIKEGTRVNLANGTYKNIEDITYDDDLLVWDFDKGELASAKPCWITVALTFRYYYKCTLSNGTVLNVIGSNGYTHRVYSMQDKSFIYINDLVGKQIYVKDAATPVTVVSVERINQSCTYYNMDTAYHINWFAEDILVGRGLENMYQFDDNMRYIKDGRTPIPYSVYEAVGISRYWYDNLRLSETTKTVEYMKNSIDRMERTMKPRP